MNIGIDHFSKAYARILNQCRQLFLEFRKGQLQFIHHYFTRCLFIAQLEQWLNQVPVIRAMPKAEMTIVKLFSEKLLQLEKNYNEIDLSELSELFLILKTKTLTQEQQKIIVTSLVSLRPKYDAYRPDQFNVKPEDQVEQFMSAWPKSTLPRRIYYQNAETEQRWQHLRNADREIKKLEADTQELRHKSSSSRPNVNDGRI